MNTVPIHVYCGASYSELQSVVTAQTHNLDSTWNLRGIPDLDRMTGKSLEWAPTVRRWILVDTGLSLRYPVSRAWYSLNRHSHTDRYLQAHRRPNRRLSQLPLLAWCRYSIRMATRSEGILVRVGENGSDRSCSIPAANYIVDTPRSFRLS